MGYVNFNEVGIKGDNLDDFIAALQKFGKKRGREAAYRWVFKLNPLAQDHLDIEMLGTDREYTRSMATRIVRGEYDYAPLPVRCIDPECPGVAWYKATFAAHRCTRCGQLNLEAEYIYVEDLLEDKAETSNA